MAEDSEVCIEKHADAACDSDLWRSIECDTDIAIPLPHDYSMSPGE